MDYIKELYFDEPIPYKNLLIYPVTMKDYFDFHWAVSCLLLEKNNTPDVKVINMSYLRYLYYRAEIEEDGPYVYMLKILLCIVLHKNIDEDIKFYTDEKGDKAYIKIDDVEYNSDDFDKISEVICLQNSIEQVDYTVAKEIRDALEDAERYKMEQNKQKMCSLEEQMICVLISTPLKMQDIYELTIRKFQKILQRVDAKLHYQIYLSASMSGMVKFKDSNAIQHWMNDFNKKDKYEDVKVDVEEIRGKIEGVNK